MPNWKGQIGNFNNKTDSQEVEFIEIEKLNNDQYNISTNTDQMTFSNVVDFLIHPTDSKRSGAIIYLFFNGSKATYIASDINSLIAEIEKTFNL